MEKNAHPFIKSPDVGLRRKGLVVFLFLAATMTFASDFSVEVGSYPDARLQVEVPDVALLSYDMLMYSQFSAKIDVFPWLYASGATTIYFYPYNDKLSFYPFYALFMVGAGVQFGPVTIGYEHRCDHAVVPYSFVADPLLRQDSGFDQVFLRYSVHF
jgi:hypothetical protein